jgi:hypothetical protein
VNDWEEIADRLAESDAGGADGALGVLLRAADVHAAAELDTHVGYYDRAAADISQALEHVEDHGSEAAIALRSVQRTMSSVATALRRRAAELRGVDLRSAGVLVIPNDVTDEVE